MFHFFELNELNELNNSAARILIECDDNITGILLFRKSVDLSGPLLSDGLAYSSADSGAITRLSQTLVIPRNDVNRYP